MSHRNEAALVAAALARRAQAPEKAAVSPRLPPNDGEGGNDGLFNSFAAASPADSRTERILDIARPLVKEFEGKRLEAYVCPAGKLTIGWGHTRSVMVGQRITESEAEDLLRQDMLEALADVRRIERMAPGGRLTDNQMAALLSWMFNFGWGKVRHSSVVIGRIRAGRVMEAADGLLQWNKIRDKHTGALVASRGLDRRREQERRLFLLDALSIPDAALEGEPDGAEAPTGTRSKSILAGLWSLGAIILSTIDTYTGVISTAMGWAGGSGLAVVIGAVLAAVTAGGVVFFIADQYRKRAEGEVVA